MSTTTTETTVKKAKSPKGKNYGKAPGCGCQKQTYYSW